MKRLSCEICGKGFEYRSVGPNHWEVICSRECIEKKRIKEKEKRERIRKKNDTHQAQKFRNRIEAMKREKERHEKSKKENQEFRQEMRNQGVIPVGKIFKPNQVRGLSFDEKFKKDKKWKTKHSRRYIKDLEKELDKLRKQTGTQKTGFYYSREWRDLRYKVLKLYGHKCQLCQTTKGPMHVDHIKPRSKYPELELDINNLQVLCEACNMGKSNTDETDWRQRPAELIKD